MSNKEKKVDLSWVALNYVDNINIQLSKRWNNWEKDLIRKNIFEVIGGILARQVSLSSQIAKNPGIWNEDVAPIILRCMADNHINLCWILSSPEKNSEDFILHGLGQLKLQLEHRKVNVQPHDEESLKMLEQEEDFINAQKYTFLTDVNLGSWSGMNTRKMAEESGELDFYNYVYQPFSNCTHSTWAHISKYNTEASSSPFHKLLRLPRVIDYNPSIHYIHLAGKYLDKSFKKFDLKYNVVEEDDSAYVILLEDLNKALSDTED